MTLMDMSEMLVSENKHQYNHTYGIDLSSVIDQCKMNKQDRTCHLCCLFALKCFHQYESLNNSNIQNNNEKNSNAILSSMNIWKDNMNDLKLNHSPLFDIPLCFHKNFSSNKQNLEIEEKVCYMKILINEYLNLIRKSYHHINHMKVFFVIYPVKDHQLIVISLNQLL